MLLFNPISLIEIRWVGARLIRQGLFDRNEFMNIYSETVDYLLNSYEISPTVILSKEIVLYESKLEDTNINDYFDRIIVSTAKIFADILLTEDRELINKLKNLDEF